MSTRTPLPVIENIRSWAAAETVACPGDPGVRARSLWLSYCRWAPPGTAVSQTLFGRVLKNDLYWYFVRRSDGVYYPGRVMR